MRFDHSKTIHRTIKLFKKNSFYFTQKKKNQKFLFHFRNDITVCIEKGMIVMEVKFKK